MATQCDLIIDYIKDKGSISSMQACTDLGITRLSARIFNLKKMGYSIRKERIQTLNRYGKRVHYDRYFLKEKEE